MIEIAIDKIVARFRDLQNLNEADLRSSLRLIFLQAMEKAQADNPPVKVEKIAEVPAPVIVAVTDDIKIPDANSGLIVTVNEAGEVSAPVSTE